jgi:hypothetical protein
MENRQDDHSSLPVIIFVACGFLILWAIVSLCYGLLYTGFTGRPDLMREPLGAGIPHGGLKLFLGLVAFLCLSPRLLSSRSLEVVDATVDKIVSWQKEHWNKLLTWLIIVTLGTIALAVLGGDIPISIFFGYEVDRNPVAPLPLFARLFVISYTIFFGFMFLPWFISAIEGIVKTEGAKNALSIVGAAAALIAIFM